MPETTDLQQRVERLFMIYSSPKNLSSLSDEKIRELVDYSVEGLSGWKFLKARQILTAIRTSSRLSALEDYDFNRVDKIITEMDNRHKAAYEEARHPGQKVERLFSNYRSPEDLSQLSEFKTRELSVYATRKLYDNDFSRAQEILEEIGTQALPSLFNALESDTFNHVYDTIINLAKKHNAGDDVARQVAGKLCNATIRSKGLNLITEIGGKPRFLIYALSDNSVEGYAEEMLRALHADERYTNIVKQELERAQDPDHYYYVHAREKAKRILNTL